MLGDVDDLSGGSAVAVGAVSAGAVSSAGVGESDGASDGDKGQDLHRLHD